LVYVVIIVSVSIRIDLVQDLSDVRNVWNEKP